MDNDDSIDRGAFLFINTTRGAWDYYTSSLDQRLYAVYASGSQDPWLSMTSPSLSIDMTDALSWISGDSNDLHVDITSVLAGAESTLGWNATTESYESLRIRTQLGATKDAQGWPLTLQDRGVLNLNPNLIRSSTGFTATIIYERMAMHTGHYANKTAAMCTYCMVDSPDQVGTQFEHIVL
jgi:hypothetical protein